jgi:enoyl-[acyl-carrier protein] reductase III
MKTAFVTGASRGIGRATALRLARDGFDVAIGYRRDHESARRVADEVNGLGRRAVLVHAELGDLDAVDQGLDGLLAEVDHVDVLVANAASTAFKPLLETKPHHVEKTFAVTIQAFLRIVQRLAPGMHEGGRIVGVSGMDTHRYVAGHGVLAAAKSALETLTKYLAVELGPRGITANAVNPGYVDTDSVALYFGGDEARRAFMDELEGSTPLRGIGTPEEVASCIAWICSPDAAWLQGQVIHLDGGIFLHAPGHSVRWWKQTGRS